MTSDVQRLLGGRFVLDSRIGSGNFAEIFRAIDTRTQSLVAIKTLRPEHSTQEQALSLFTKEGEVGSAISHENVVKILSHGVDDDIHFIVMELVRGISLRRRLTLVGQLSVPESLRIMKAVLRGLEAIHEAGYIHRDIKPQNILIDAQGTPKITDFGIAISPGEPRINPIGLALGTAAYIAPEQAAGEETGPEADIYSAGAVLFEMLTGEAPFPGDDPITVMNRHLFEPPRDPRSINLEISPALSAIVTRALAKDPKARFSSARKMREALDLIEPDDELTLDASHFAPPGNLAWTVPLGPSRRLPVRILGMPALTTFVSALLLVVLIIVLMLALVSSLAIASGSEGRLSSSQPESGMTGGDTPFDDLRPSMNRPEVHTASIPNWSVGADLSSSTADAAVSAAKSPTPSPTITPEPTQAPVIAQVATPTPTPVPTATAQATAAPQPTQTTDNAIISVSTSPQQPVTIGDSAQSATWMDRPQTGSDTKSTPRQQTHPDAKHVKDQNQGQGHAPTKPEKKNKPADKPQDAPKRSGAPQAPAPTKPEKPSPSHGNGDRHAASGHHGHG